MKHYRAYTTTVGHNSWTDRASRERMTEEFPVEDVAFEGEYTGDTVEFDAGDTVISKVVFYEGEGDDAAVTGTLDINTSGPISATLPPAP